MAPRPQRAMVLETDSAPDHPAVCFDGVVDRRRVGGTAEPDHLEHSGQEFGRELILGAREITSRGSPPRCANPSARARSCRRRRRRRRQRTGSQAGDTYRRRPARSGDQRLAPATLIGEEEDGSPWRWVLHRPWPSRRVGARSAQSGLGVAINHQGDGDGHAGRVPRGEVAVSQLASCAAAGSVTSNSTAVASTASVERADWSMRDVSFSANDERYLDGGQPQR